MTLLFVAGASPQIITETAYWLLEDPLPSGEICVLTTSAGQEIINRQLLARGGAWGRFVKEYPRARRFRLGRDNIEVLKGARGRPLEDLRSAEDNMAVADQIAGFVERRTRAEAPPLHASIAGGRKTMGYLLAAAMMLYGRREDRLSHVLVHPPDLEGTDFYFPPPRAQRTLTFHRPDGSPVKVAARDIRVELADLPFLRLRGLHDPGTLRRGAFSTLVEQLQRDLDALAEPQLCLLPDGGGILCSGRPVRLSPVRLAIYELLAERRRDGCGRPGCEGCERCFVHVDEMTGAFRERLRERLKSRQSAGVGLDRWNEGSFRAERSKINEALGRALRAARKPFEIRVVGEKKDRQYGLALDPSAIDVAQ